MANAGGTTGPYSGRPAFYLELYVVRIATDIPNNRSQYRWELYAQNPTGGTSFAYDCFPWGVSVGGVIWTGCHSLDFSGGQSSILLGIANTGWYTHDAAGYLTLAIDANHGPASLFGTADPPIANFVTDRIPKVPDAPQPYPSVGTAVDQATTTSLRYRFEGFGNGGSPILEWQIEWSTNPAFPSGSWNSAVSSGTSTVTGLNPGTTYYFRSRGRNAVGWSAYSAVASGTTLPAVPPGMVVTPALSGTSASVALSPPAGVGSVTSYRVERRPVGGGATVYNTATSPLVVSGLTPGTIYEWRASAFIGAYQTPWTAWTPVVQPNPNTNPGDYFDGSTVDTPDVDFVWTGTVNNSTSKAQGLRATGWRTFAEGIGTSGLGGTQGVQVRVTEGLYSPFASRVTFFADAPSAGYAGGTAIDNPGRQAVAEGGIYWGSIYVQPSRSQRMAAHIRWYTAGGVFLGSTAGTPEIVPAGPIATRLLIQATAPATAAWAAIGWIDVAGAGHSVWLGGESVTQDRAMMSIGELYDWFSGSTADNAFFSYEWEGTPNASISSRTTLDAADSDPLADPDCPPIPTPPQPPAIADDCIEEEGTWRRYWAIIPQDQITDWLDLVPTIEITTGPLAARQVRIRVYRNPLGLDPSEFPADTWDAEQIVSYIPPLTTLTIDGVAQRVWAEIDGAEPIAADRLLYGTGGGPATWPVLSCGTAYLVSFDVPLDAPEGNLSVDVALTTRML